MASVRLGSVVSDIRGSIAQQTYGRNAGGIFVRERVQPNQTETPPRALTRLTFAACREAWSATLTEAHRSTWRQYSRRFPRPNCWGEPANSGGINPWIRCAFLRNMIGDGFPFLTAPTEPPPHAPPFEFTIDYGPPTLVMDMATFTWLGPPDGTYLFWFVGKPRNAGRVYYTGPWQFAGANYKDGGEWNWSPWTVGYPWPIAAGQRVTCRLLAQLPTGALSAPYLQADTPT